MVKTVAEINARLRAITTELDSIESKRSAACRSFTSEENTQVDQLLTEAEGLRQSRTMKLAQALNETRVSSSTSDPRDPVENPDGSRYSLLRAIERRAQGLPIDGYEGEISQEIARRSGNTAKGFFMPIALPMGTLQRSQERRDFDTTAGAGAIQTTVVSSRFIDMLRNRAVLAGLGATIISDMVGPFALPKQTSAGAAYWVAEGVAPTESAPAIGQVAFTPATLGCYTDITRKLTKQTGLDSEMFVRNDLNKVIAIELDRAGVNGSGSGAEPTGILQDSGITTVAIGTNGGAPTWAKLVEMESTVAAANADAGTMGYLTSCLGRGKLKVTEKGSAGYPTFLWGDNDQMNGYRAMATNQIPTNLSKGSGTNLTAVIFGDFSSLIMALWGGIDILVDPYTGGTTGTVRVIMLLDAQIKFRTKESLCKIVDMTR